MVTADDVWAGFAEIPDPEIPVISLVDLGVIRSVDVRDGHVRVELTPTFLGCPALEAMVRAIEAKVGELGAAADVAVINDDSWSTDKITAAGREKLRAAGFAPPAGRRGLVQLQSQSTAARTAARRKRTWRTSSARPRAARSATATRAGSRSSSSRRSRSRGVAQ